MELLSDMEYFFATIESRKKAILEYQAQERLERQRLRPIKKPSWSKAAAERYNMMFSQQGGICAICRRQETAKGIHGRIRRLSTDHCHNSGQIRGLLCGRCNAGLGYFQDNTESLKKAILYLEKSHEVPEVRVSATTTDTERDRILPTGPHTWLLTQRGRFNDGR